MTEKYNVSLIFSADFEVEVEADSPDDAAEKAYNSDAVSVSLCHQCSKDINIGDCYRVIVCDEAGNEVIDDGYELAKIKQQAAEIATLTAKLAEAEIIIRDAALTKLLQQEQLVEAQRDAERLNFLDQFGNRNILAVGSKWYWRKDYNLPYNTTNNLREAIDAAIARSTK